MKTPTPNLAKPRRDRLIQDRVHDPYRNNHKLPEPSFCPECRALFKNGRWQWVETWPADARPNVCQACQRIRDDFPAGLVTLEGAFVRTHRDEVLNLSRNHEKEENAQHPLHRIMKIEETPDSILIKTTDLHLPRRIGEALRRAYEGELEVQYRAADCFVRVNWKRES